MSAASNIPPQLAPAGSIVPSSAAGGGSGMGRGSALGWRVVVGCREGVLGWDATVSRDSRPPLRGVARRECHVWGAAKTVGGGWELLPAGSVCL